jgi:hypothetical protein
MPSAYRAPRLSPLHWRVFALVLAMAMAVDSAQAGRPLSTEDAGTNAQSQCQVEAWVDHRSDGHTSHLAPACGLADGLELGVELVKASPGDTASQGHALSVKWAPEWLSWQSWRLGAKLGTASERAPHESTWHQASTAALAIASLPLDPQWTLHLNLGRQRNKLDQITSSTYGAALVWTPHERWVVFGELNGDNKTPASQAIGLRYWLLPDQLGLDVTGSRTNATPGSRSWGVGLGWYGLHF